MKKKNIVIIIVIALLLILIGGISIILLNKKSKTNTLEDVLIKNTLEDVLIKYGSNFYENNYYANMKDKSVLANFTDSGLNISVKAAKVVLPLDKDTEKLLDKNKCNYENTKFSFYPISPYNSTDYKIKVELACEK